MNPTKRRARIMKLVSLARRFRLSFPSMVMLLSAVDPLSKARKPHMAKAIDPTVKAVSPLSSEFSHMGVVPVTDVWADWKANPRGHGKLPSEDDPLAFGVLQRSIRDLGGLLQPILCVHEEGPDGAKYRVIAGYRRYEAMRQLSTDDPKFSHIGITVRASQDVDFGQTEDMTGKDDPEGLGAQYNRKLLKGKLGELVMAATENGMRQDVSVWDRIRTATVLAKEGISIQEATSILAESGQALSANTIRNYTKIGSFSAKVQKRLRALGGAGFKIALQVLSQEYNMATAPAIKWDETKQMAKIDELTKAIEEKQTNKKNGVKPPKPSRYTITPAELDERWTEIEAVAGPDVVATLAYLTGRATRADLVVATDEEFAAALTGEGADLPKDDEAPAASE